MKDVLSSCDETRAVKWPMYTAAQQSWSMPYALNVVNDSLRKPSELTAAASRALEVLLQACETFNDLSTACLGVS